MSESKPKKERGAIDTLVTRDQTAAFWFVVAVITACACAWYVTKISTEMNLRPPFVVMDAAGGYYVPPGLPYSEMKRMHLHLAEVAAETIFERSEAGLVYGQRLDKLCWDRNVVGDILKRTQAEAKDFRRLKMSQTVEIEDTTLLGATASEAGTLTTGYLRRFGFFQGREQQEIYQFTLKLRWAPNLRIVSNKMFPSLIKEVYKIELTQINES